MVVAAAGEVRLFVLALNVRLHAFEPGGVATFAAEALRWYHLQPSLAVPDGGALWAGIPVQVEPSSSPGLRAGEPAGGCLPCDPGDSFAEGRGTSSWCLLRREMMPSQALQPNGELRRRAARWYRSAAVVVGQARFSKVRSGSSCSQPRSQMTRPSLFGAQCRGVGQRW